MRDASTNPAAARDQPHTGRQSREHDGIGPPVRGSLDDAEYQRRLRAANAQALAGRLPLALEMLAAHVMPNHPAVTALVAEAAERLEQTTGSGALVATA